MDGKNLKNHVLHQVVHEILTVFLQVYFSLFSARFRNHSFKKSLRLLVNITDDRKCLTGVTGLPQRITENIQNGPKKCIHSLLINIFGINLNEISISGWECNIMFSQQMAQALL